MLHCAVGIVKDSENKILISQRPSHKVGGGFWEFPGGKVEALETVEEALARELEEEVGITPLKFQHFLKYSYRYSTYEVLLDVFIIEHFIGEAKGLEGQSITWANIIELEKYSFLEANTRIIKKLMSLV